MGGMDTGALTPPFSLLAEITHRCPLHCLYCSNPLELVRRGDELPTRTWLRVVEEAAELGVLQLHLSGGEPLARSDLVVLLERATQLDLYANVITSGVGLSRARAEALREAGLRSVQLSLQAAGPRESRAIAGGDFWEQKMAAAREVRRAGMSLSMNFVLHRHNLERITELLALAAALGAERVELANTQYYGWAWRNRGALLPSRAMVERAEEEVRRFRERIGAAMEIVWVVSDYHASYPKPCMNGWGRMFLTVSPDGKVLPCPAAYVIPDLALPSVRDHSLRCIWYESPAFNRFRGFDWMTSPCRSCPKRFADYGGCRCQAYLVAGDAAATDPVCIYSPDHHLVAAAVEGAWGSDPRGGSYRSYPGRPLVFKAPASD